MRTPDSYRSRQQTSGRPLRAGPSCLCALAGLLACLPSPGWAAPPDRASSAPEDGRFDNMEFRRGLKQRGLDDLLAYYDRHHFPQGGIEAKLLERERLLGTYENSALPDDERADALHRAIALLEEVIAETDRQDAPRRWSWLLELGRDLLYRQADPHYNVLQYRGWSPADAEELLALAVRAEDAFRQAEDEITGFVARLDDSTAGDFRRLERRGVIDTADEVQAQAAYFRQWARYYQALARGPKTQTRSRLLQDVIEFLQAPAHPYTTTPHEETGVQAQALLLTGMAYRLLGTVQQSGEALKQALAVVEEQAAPEAGQLRWVSILAHLELAKLSRDVGRYDFAHAWVAKLSEWRDQHVPDNFALSLTLALLDGSISRRQADDARSAGQTQKAQKHEVDIRRPLLDLLRANPARRGEIFRAVYPLVDAQRPISSLDAFDKHALIAGLLGDAASLRRQVQRDAPDPAARARMNESLRRVIELGEAALEDPSDLGQELRPIALYNVAVAAYQLGRADQAVERFVQLVREHPDFDQADAALEYALTVAADGYQGDEAKLNPRRLATFVLAVRTLVETRPESEEARYWRYFLADALGRQGKLAEAVEQCALVSPTSEHYAAAAHMKVVLLWDLYVRERAAQATANTLRRSLLNVIEAARRSEAIQDEGLTEAQDPARRRERLMNKAGARLLAAEAHAQEAVGRPEQTLELLTGFEETFAGLDNLLGRALRLRILAYQELGRFDQASAIVDEFLLRDPASAGPVMDELLRSMTDALHELRNSGRREPEKAQQAVEMALKLHDWAEQHPELLGDVPPASFEVRLANAYLAAEQNRQALELLTAYVEQDAARQPDGRCTDAEALRSLGEALFELKRYDQAHEVFYDLWLRQPEGSDIWWTALLGSLQVHTRLKSDPQRILNEIRKQRFLRPNLGGPVRREQFAQLERINEQRLAQSKS